MLQSLGAASEDGTTGVFYGPNAGQCNLDREQLVAQPIPGRATGYLPLPCAPL